MRVSRGKERKRKREEEEKRGRGKEAVGNILTKQKTGREREELSIVRWEGEEGVAQE